MDITTPILLFGHSCLTCMEMIWIRFMHIYFIQTNQYSFDVRKVVLCIGDSGRWWGAHCREAPSCVNARCNVLAMLLLLWILLHAHF